MLKIAFVCFGNICRSPVAELVFKDLLEREGLSGKAEVTSCGTSDCESGSHIYPRAKQTLVLRGIDGDHVARQISEADLDSDFIVCMDAYNYADLMRIRGIKKERVRKLRSFTADPRDVADPWYTKDFEKAFSDIEEGCKGFLNYLKERDLI